jgi:hypothetical protein
MRKALGCKTRGFRFFRYLYDTIPAQFKEDLRTLGQFKRRLTCQKQAELSCCAIQA